MGRKKKKVEKPWCWYCNREFDDEKILIQHQKAKHFKCHICHKKLFSGPGLSIHCMQVHKEAVERIPGAVMGRDSTDADIYGMQGIPYGTHRGVEEPDEKRARMDMPPMPPGPMPPFPPSFPQFMPPMPSFMPPLPPFPQRPAYAPPAVSRGFGAFSSQPILTNPGPARGPIGPSDPMRYDEGYNEDYGGHYPGQDAYEGDHRYDGNGYDGLPPAIKSEPQVSLPVAAAASKIGSKTKIIHPDDYNISLEERRMAMFQ